MSNDLETKVDTILEQQQQILDGQEEITETLQRVEEALLNMSTPGSGYAIERYEELE